MGYNDAEYIAGSIILLMTTASLIGSLLTIFLIRDLQRWNGYMLLVYNLSISAAVYDFSFYFLFGFRSVGCFSVYKLLAIFSGSAVTLWTNVMSLVLCYTVCTLTSVNIQASIRSIGCTIHCLAAAMAIAVVAVYLVDHDDESMNKIYYWLRVASIALNIVIYLVLFAVLNPYIRCHRGLAECDETLLLLSQLTSRLAYYPIVQVITRVGASWWEYQYGFQPDAFDSTGAFPLDKQIALYLYAISAASAGLGYFLVFITVQPLARARMWVMLGCKDKSRNDSCATDVHSELHHYSVDHGHMLSPLPSPFPSPVDTPMPSPDLTPPPTRPSSATIVWKTYGQMDEDELWQELEVHRSHNKHRSGQQV